MRDSLEEQLANAKETIRHYEAKIDALRVRVSLRLFGLCLIWLGGFIIGWCVGFWMRGLFQ